MVDVELRWNALIKKRTNLQNLLMQPHTKIYIQLPNFGSGSL